MTKSKKKFRPVRPEAVIIMMQRQEGVTLVELMVALVVLGVVMVFVQVIFLSQQRTYTVQGEVSSIQQDVRVSLEIIATDLRSAGFGIGPDDNVTPIGLATDADDLGYPDDPNPDSITFNTAQGATTYVMTAPDAGGMVQVENGGSFNETQIVNMIKLQNKKHAAPGDFEIKLIDTVLDPDQITLDPVPTEGDVGDILVGAVFTITYCVEGDTLKRLSTNAALAIIPACGDPPSPFVTEEDLTTGVQDFQVSYNGGLNTVAVTALDTIQKIRITLVTQTTGVMAKTADGEPRTRELTTVVRLHNAF